MAAPSTTRAARSPAVFAAGEERRQQTFFGDADYLTYLHLAAEAFSEARVEVWGWCA